MTHEDAGHYAEKHPGAELDEKIALRLKEKIVNDSITCAEAHKIARDLNIHPSNVGVAIDLLEIHIKKCQLGLFGHGTDKTSAVEVSSEILKAIEAGLVNDRLPCTAAWDISKKLKVSKIAITAACEKMKIKISSCQLRTF